MKFKKGDILKFSKGRAAYSANDGAQAIFTGEFYTDRDGGELIGIKWVRNGDDNEQNDGEYYSSMFIKVEEPFDKKEDRIFKQIKKEKVMKDLKFSFEEGKQRVIDMLEEHINDFTHAMLQDVRMIINEDRDEIVDQIEDIIESIRMNTNYCEKAIKKVQNSSTVAEILSSMEGTCYEEMEETVLTELFGLESITRKD
jgi:hypothetical protein